MNRSINEPTLTPPVSERDHMQGEVDAPVTLLEYGDYECPYCGQAVPMVKEVERQMGNQLRFVFRHFPLTDSHPHALDAAQAAEAAADQGKYWAMHDALYENQTALDRRHLVEYASTLGLDTHRFTQALENKSHLPRIRADFQSGEESGVQGTPTFFINGVPYEGEYDAEELLTAIRSRIGG